MHAGTLLHTSQRLHTDEACPFRVDYLGYRLMPPLPVVSGQEDGMVFEKTGHGVNCQRGSDLVIHKPGMNVVLPVPSHRTLNP
jgi:hypothetical protein